MSVFSKLASAIRNDVVGGLRGYHTNESMNLEQLEDEIVDMRMQVIKEYQLKGVLPINDLMLAINCIPVDCKDIEKCNKCLNAGFPGTPTAHFEIPQIFNDYGIQAISYIGTIDKQTPFIFYTNSYAFNIYHKYRKRGKNKPYVWIDVTPNENGMYDCFVFNAPLLKVISVVAIFKDPRQLEVCDRCSIAGENKADDNFTWINNEVKRRLTELKIKYYRQLAPPVLPNNQQYTAG